MHCTIKGLIATVVFAALTPALLFSAQPGDQHVKHSPHASSNHDRSADQQDDKWERDPVTFSMRDRSAIRNYYRSSSSLSPGLAQRNGNLPPGLQKQLQRNGTLPPALKDRMQSLPIDIERQLPLLFSGYSRGMIGPDVVIVNERTQRVMDIIRDVAFRR